MIELRAACETDIDWIIAQLKEHANFYGTKHSLFGDEKYARQFLAEMMKTHFVRVAVFIGEDGTQQPVGYIAAVLGPHPFNPAIQMLSEQFWWVPDEHRGSRAAGLLFNEFLAFGKENADIMAFSIIEGRTPIKDDALTKRGFKLHERAFIMEN